VSRSRLLKPRQAVGAVLAARRRCRVRYGWGFTLIELMLSVTIIGTLTAIATPKLRGAIEHARVAHAIGDIRAVQSSIDGANSPPGNPYMYIWHGGDRGAAKKDRFQVPLNSMYDLYSMGKDGATAPALTAAASKDDIVRANDGGYVGLGSKY
jgi:general secretion pathway protein G